MSLTDVFAEERKDVVVVVALEATAEPGDCDVLSATVSYINVISGRIVSREGTLAVQRAERCAAAVCESSRSPHGTGPHEHPPQGLDHPSLGGHADEE